MERSSSTRLHQSANESARSGVTTNGSEQRRRIATLRRLDGLSAIASLRQHWPEYLMEVGELGCYLFAARLRRCYSTLPRLRGKLFRAALLAEHSWDWPWVRRRLQL
jgi:hypothetical protein